jgi:hypothetical protein
MTAACSKGGGVVVDSGGVTMTRSLRKGTAVPRSEARVKAAGCSRAGDEAMACSGVGIKDGRWQWRYSGF